MSKDPHELGRLFDYSFKDPELLYQALRHPSYVHERDDPGMSDNQRLEFLGDAVINLAISNLLIESYPHMNEGDLSKHRASLVSETGLAPIAQELELGAYILLGRGEERTNGRNKLSILTDALEALMGAIYLDGGFTSALRVITGLFGPSLNGMTVGKWIKDFKTDLQEYSQQALRLTPEYILERETGPDHSKTFYVAVYLKEDLMGKGEGKSKKEAEQNAAKEALACLRK